MPDDDGLCCASMAVASHAYLRERALHIEGEFAVSMVREDGDVVDVESNGIAALANLIAVLRPPVLELDVGADEDHAAILAALTPVTVH